MKDLLLRAIEQFHYELPTGEFAWAPYLRNDDYTENNKIVRGLGKSAPVEIKKSIDIITRQNPLINPEEARLSLTSGALPGTNTNYKGVDCSGFLYHVFSYVYKKLYGQDFYTILSIPKHHVLNGAQNLSEWQKAHTLTEQESQQLPEDVPLSYVIGIFKRQPANLCRVTGLLSDYSSTSVDVVDIQPGDLIGLQKDGDTVPHICVVLELNEARNEIKVAHSTRKNPADIGGILFESISVSGKSLDTSGMQTKREVTGIRRLKQPK